MVKIYLPKLDKDLLSECSISFFRSSGSGGQHINVTDSAVRLTHIPSSITVTSQKFRSQYQNKMECLKKLRKIIMQLNYKKPKRIPTKIPKSVILKNKQKKLKVREKKRLRRPVKNED